METNRIDELANDLSRKGKIDQLEKQLLKYKPNKLNAKEKESWYHLYGIIPFRNGNRQLAFERFIAGTAACPDSSYLQFSLGQEHEFRKNKQEMIECFDKTSFPNIPSSYILAEARYCYLWDLLDEGIKYVNQLIPYYLQLKILDTNFLYMRGMPFFQQTWQYLVAFSKLKGDYTLTDGIFYEVKSNCSDIDFDYLDMLYICEKKQDYEIIGKSLKERLLKDHGNNFPNGYQRMQLAILESRKLPSYDEAISQLSNVSLFENDFPWLEDIRTLAMCEIANRFNKENEETSYQMKLMNKQALLFEPDNALNFFLLDYQEKLKIKYRNREIG
jgi:hypothetical protein